MGQWITGLLRGKDSRTGRPTDSYFEVDGKPLGEKNPKWLNDDYAKFIRFAQWRISRTGYGILAFITNHGYLDNPTFRGMRQSLMKTFDDIYILDLHGNSKKKERAPDGGKDENVFDIQQGVAIGFFVKRMGDESKPAAVYHADLWGMREQSEGQEAAAGKYCWLWDNDITTTQWAKLEPSTPNYLFVRQNIDLKAEYEKGWNIGDVLPVNSAGVVTARDALSIHWNKDSIWQTVNQFIALPAEEARAKYQLGDDVRDWKVAYAQKDVMQSGLSKSRIVSILYRPCDIRYTYYTGHSRGFHCMPRSEVMRHMISNKNYGLITTRQTRDDWDVYTTDTIIGHKALAAYDINSLFPLYLYPDNTEGQLLAAEEPTSAPGGRRPNLAGEFIQEAKERLKMDFVEDGKGNLAQTFGPEDIFNYMYAIFYSPGYRSRYAEFLKRDFPRLPLTADRELFRLLCGLGSELVGLHLMERSAPPITGYPIRGDNIVEKVSYSEPGQGAEDGRVWINKTQYFAGVPTEVWDFHIGGYRVCEKWLKDRKGRTLGYDDLNHYQQVAAALAETIRLMAEIDRVIEAHGGWPLAGS